MPTVNEERHCPNGHELEVSIHRESGGGEAPEAWYVDPIEENCPECGEPWIEEDGEVKTADCKKEVITILNGNMSPREKIKKLKNVPVSHLTHGFWSICEGVDGSHYEPIRALLDIIEYADERLTVLNDIKTAVS